jgi:PAS domain S-box-containing protein
MSSKCIRSSWSCRTRICGAVSRCLRAYEKKYFDLYDLAPIGYVTLDQKGLIREINLTGAALLGTERRRLDGRRFARFVAQPEREGFHRFHRRLFEIGKFEECELKLVSADGAPVDVLLSGIAVRDIEGSLNLRQIAVTDIMLRKRAEERERLAVIGETAARFAHEISNPLKWYSVQSPLLREVSARDWS